MGAFMSKRVLLPLVLFVLVLAGVFIYFFKLSAKPLNVVGTSVGGQTLVNPLLPITIFFNRTPVTNEVSVSFSPNVVTSLKIANNSIQIVPQSRFNSETEYSAQVNTKPPFIFSFTTQRTTENYPGWNDHFNEILQQHLQTTATQDASLADIRKNAPVRLAGFTVDYSYENNTYAVTLSPPYDQNRANFLLWLVRKGITDTSNLRIKYINQ